jgi:hypothetical protein
MTDNKDRKLNHSQQNKNLLEFIDKRLVKLKQNKSTEEILKLSPKRRELYRKQIRGRILELVHLKGVIARGDYDKITGDEG